MKINNYLFEKLKKFYICYSLLSTKKGYNFEKSEKNNCKHAEKYRLSFL